MQRYFAKNLSMDLFELELSDYHHIKVVLRNKPGDKIEVVYQQELYLCALNDNLIPQLLTKISNDDHHHSVNITIAPALIKENNWNYLLQKATELGVYKIIPLITKRTVIKISSTKSALKIIRWQKIMKEASEQSKRLEIPLIFDIIDIDKLNIDGYDLLLFGSTSTKISLRHYIKEINSNTKILLVTGPEGGFSKDEENKLINKGFLPFTLGNNILRAETAPIVAISMINYELME